MNAIRFSTAWWAYWTGVSAVLLTGLAALAGGLTWFFSIRDARENQQRALALELKVAEQQERAAKAEKDVLTLRKAMMPRRIIFGSRDGDEAVRQPLFEAVAKYSGTLAVLQSAPDIEAETLAADIAGVLKQSGWTVQRTNESVSKIANAYFATGVHLFTLEKLPSGVRDGESFSAENSASQAGKAAQALRRLLTLDLGPPHGPAFTGVQWHPEYKEMLPLVTKHGFAFPNAAVVIVVGTRPIEEFLSLPPDPR